jgi:hypothetical protein
MQIENAQLVLHKPSLYEEIRSRELLRKSAEAANPPQRYPIEGAYLFEPDGSIGFRIARRHPHAALVIDPSLSITYSTFLGGTGEDTANSIAADSTGKLSIAIAATLLIIPTQLIARPQPPLAPQPSRSRQQTRQHKPTANRPTTNNQKLHKHVSPRIAIAATLEIALILSMLSCGAKAHPSRNPAPQPTHTPSPYPPPPQAAPHPQPNPSP